MKVILENAVSSISANTEDASYPVENLLDNHPQKMYKVANTSDDYAEITVGTLGTTGGLGLVNIIADRASIYIENPNGIIWEPTNTTWANVTWKEYPNSLNKEIVFDTTQEYNTLWVDFNQFEGSVDIIIKLYMDKEYTDKKLSAGVLKVGVVQEIKEVIYPINIELVDYSYERLLSNGAIYYNKRNIVKRIKGSLLTNYNTYTQFMYELAQKYGKKAIMWLIEEDSCAKLVLYGRMATLPVTNTQNTAIRTISFEITEVL
jgi:hypothetical protein